MKNFEWMANDLHVEEFNTHFFSCLSNILKVKIFRTKIKDSVALFIVDTFSVQYLLKVPN